MKTAEEENESFVVDDIEKIGNFYRGVVCKLHRSPERGKIRTASGREVPFTFAHLRMAGSHRRFEDLHEGMEVGYDLGWTSKGLRVHVIWVPEDETSPSVSERQSSPEEDEAPHHLADEHGEDGDIE